MKRFAIFALALIVASVGTAAAELAFGLPERTGGYICGLLVGAFIARYLEHEVAAWCEQLRGDRR